MLVLDGCFTIELFRKEGDQIPKGGDDPIFSMSCMFQFLQHDLILLESQTPWFVLELLFNKTKLPSETKSLIELSLHFFRTLFIYSAQKIDPKLSENRDIKHILDLIRLELVLPSEEVKNYKQQNFPWKPIPSATRLQEAGVRFVKVINANNILDMKFQNGVLKITKLLIHETTETIIRNLISYEQCLPTCSPVFTSYAKIMDNLIDTTDEMEIFRKKKIFEKWLSPEDAQSSSTSFTMTLV